MHEYESADSSLVLFDESENNFCCHRDLSGRVSSSCIWSQVPQLECGDMGTYVRTSCLCGAFYTHCLHKELLGSQSVSTEAINAGGLLCSAGWSMWICHISHFSHSQWTRTDYRRARILLDLCLVFHDLEMGIPHALFLSVLQTFVPTNLFPTS